MGAKSEALAKQFEAKVQDAAAVLQKLSDVDWKKTTPGEKWTVGVVAHHVASSHEGIANIVKAVASGQAMPTFTVEMLDAMNHKHAQENANATKAHTLVLHQKNATAAAVAVRALSDDQLAKSATVLQGMPAMNVEQIETMFRVNLLGVVYSIEAVLPEMLKRRSGHLAAVSSLAAYKGLPGETAYCASKAAVNSYMEGLRIQLRKHHIAVTTICPGFVRTPMTDINQFKMPWLIEVDDAARRIARALRRRKKVFNFPWQTTLLMKLTRWLPDWIVARTMQSYNENPPMPK